VPRVRELLSDAEPVLSEALRPALAEVTNEIRELEARIRGIEKQLNALAAQTPVITRLRTVPRDWPSHLDGSVCIRRRRAALPVRATLLDLPRPHASGVLERIAPTARSDPQARR
jgi:hypothetical protein